MREVIQTAPVWTIGAGLSGITAEIHSMSFLTFCSWIAIVLGIIATLYNLYARYREHKATMRKLKDDN